MKLYALVEIDTSAPEHKQAEVMMELARHVWFGFGKRGRVWECDADVFRGREVLFDPVVHDGNAPDTHQPRRPDELLQRDGDVRTYTTRITGPMTVVHNLASASVFVNVFDAVTAEPVPHHATFVDINTAIVKPGLYRLDPPGFVPYDKPCDVRVIA